MRHLLLKDLQILRRSPLVTALLVIYPIAIAVLIGFALSDEGGQPRVAFFNQVDPEEQFAIGAGEEELDRGIARNELCKRVECVDVSSREEAERMVEDGEVLGALIVPPDILDKLESLTSLNPEQPTVEVLVNEDDPVKAQLVDDRVQALITEANLILAQRISESAEVYLNVLIEGGDFEIPLLGQTFDVLGLDNAAQILQRVERELPAGSQAAKDVEDVIEFAELAGENLDFALPLLGAVASPIEVDKTVVAGGGTSLDAFAIAVAATVTLMFVTVLLVAGSLALEREENAYPRLTRGLISPGALLAEKVLLGAVASLAVTLLMLAGLSLFVSIDWGRIGLILVAILAGGAAFAAFGAALGGAAREVRASSLLAFMVSLPIAFLSLVPSGAVGAGVFDLIQVVRALFPFDPALDAMSAALDDTGPSIGVPLLHLAAVIAAYGVLARVALRRFG
jgi:ABC-type transport system involved in cytochrome c biogenesis permease component